jgi:nitrite reductase/ring-hydroxylating ferredoxin subunit
MADAGPLIALCPSSALADRGDGLRFEVEVGGKATGAFAVRFGGRVVAYLNRCAHVAMELDWIEGRFLDADGESIVCATHGAAYGPDDGRCLGGPCAGRGGLRPLQVLERDGWVYWRPDAEARPRPQAPEAG